MTVSRISEIKDKLTQGLSGLSRKDVEWLIKRVEELTEENAWLKRELSYSENQGEVGY
jgi:hypothetical protein